MTNKLRLVTTSNSFQYQQPSKLIEKVTLESEIRSRDLDIKLDRLLKGGFTSQVYSGILGNEKIVIKHTEHLIPFDPTEIFLDKEQNNVDAKVLHLLQNSKEVKVPKVLFHWDDITTTIMENTYEKGFLLLNDIILAKTLTTYSAAPIGFSIANFIKESRKWINIKTSIAPEECFYERGLELRLAYPNSQNQFLQLEKEYLTNNQYYMWPDTHPKNIFVNGNGDCVFIDFGFVHKADQRFILPNFLAHIVLYSLAGYVSSDIAREYILKCVEAYSKIEPVNELIFCQYLAMEVLHRSYGKWIQGIDFRKQKTKLISFGLQVFDDNIKDIDSLLSLI